MDTHIFVSFKNKIKKVEVCSMLGMILH